MWELDHKEGWAPKNWCFQTVVLEKTLESPLNNKEIKPVNPKENQPWISTGRTEAEAPILQPLDGKSWLIRKDPDTGKDWGQEEKVVTEDETRLSDWTTIVQLLGFPGGASDKEPACQCRRRKKHQFEPWVRKIPWRRAWQPIPVFLSGESHGQRSLAAYSLQVAWLKQFNRHACIWSLHYFKQNSRNICKYIPADWPKPWKIWSQINMCNYLRNLRWDTHYSSGKFSSENHGHDYQ